MTLLVVGASHKTAPIAVLDQLARTDQVRLASEALASEHIAESMVVSTCNRLEVYAEADRFHAAVNDICALLAKGAGIPVDELVPHCYVRYDERAIQHMFELAAGLDSMVVGEQQIMGQVRAAVVAAQDSGTAGRELNEVGQAALRVGKLVRSATPIDGAGASIVSIGLAQAFERLAGLGGTQPGGAAVVVIGAGALGSLTLAHLARLGVGKVTVANRSPSDEQGRRLGRGADVAGLNQLPELIADSDLVVCCTGATGVVLTTDIVRPTLIGRGGRPLVVLDMAMPHDSEIGIADLPGVVRLDLSDVGLAAADGAEPDGASAARRVVAEELTEFVATRAAREFEPVMLSLRAWGSAVVDEELLRVRGRLSDVTQDQWEEIELGFRRAFNTLLHTPTVRLKELATDRGGAQYAQVLNSLFNLAVDQVAPVSGTSDADLVDLREAERLREGVQ
ncbi:MAG: glutamyl-tRNA reductase [Candidatus Nanopelagicales bacterium]|nr:glutamyl-tRNA reductase [Candidatus Nanopelagicales bacterium]